jgi:hypothetical protein
MVWDEKLIRDLFWQVDAHCILQIPISAGREDFVAWHHNRNGLLSVRSAYHCQWKYKFGRNQNSMRAGGQGNDEVWSKLWKLDRFFRTGDFF